MLLVHYLHNHLDCLQENIQQKKKAKTADPPTVIGEKDTMKDLYEAPVQMEKK